MLYNRYYMVLQIVGTRENSHKVEPRHVVVESGSKVSILLSALQHVKDPKVSYLYVGDRWCKECPYVAEVRKENADYYAALHFLFDLRQRMR